MERLHNSFGQSYTPLTEVILFILASVTKVTVELGVAVQCSSFNDFPYG